MSFFFLHSAFFFFLLPSLVMDAERHPKLPALSIKMLSDVTLLELLKHPRTSGAFLVQSSWHIQTLLPIILTFFNLYICLLVKLSERWKWSRRSKGLKGCLNHEDDKPGPRKLFLLIHSQAIHYTVNLLWNTLYKHIWFFNDQDVFGIYTISPSEIFSQTKIICRGLRSEWLLQRPSQPHKDITQIHTCCEDT